MTSKKYNISVIVIARDEEEKIADCIESVEFANEILVFDNDSIDKTAKIAKDLGAIVKKINKGDYSDRKNKAFSEAKYDWILSLDADERVGDLLKDEIINVISSSDPETGVYAIPRNNIIFGKKFMHGGQWPDYVIRLFAKDKYLRWEGELHEQPKFKGELKYLKNPLTHLKHDNISDMVEKTNIWSEVEAKLMLDAKHPKMNIFRFASAILREFNLRMVKQRAYRDGNEGIVYALYQVFSRYLSYAKLWEMQLASNKKIHN